MRAWALAPWHDTLHGLDRCLRGEWRRLGWLFLGLVVGWWLYVPVHELLHAWGCLAFGGEVSELEIAHLYGGAVLARLIPFVTAGSDYAGRLSGFDTGGSDLVYLATDFAPFLLTLFPGVWLFRRAAAAGHAFFFGFWLPTALAPFLSLTGDAYEIGSILTTRLPPWKDAAAVLRGDDVFLMAEGLAASAGAPWGGFALAVLLGLLWAYLTYGAGWGVSRLLAGRKADLVS